uniref:response regulator n=1 Tax=Escherichia coli TaxID=562 RepID=UPI00200A6679
MADILVVEDEDNIATALDFLLSRDGHKHRRMATGAGAVEETRANRPDLVLLDVMLPDVSGYQIVQDVRADPA